MIFGIELQPLYFQAQEDGTAYVVDGERAKNTKMPWGWGWRLGFEAPLKHDSWNAKLLWTSLPIERNSHASGHLIPLWTQAPSAPSDFVTSADTRWRLHFGVVDLGLERRWCVSPHLSLTPFMGVRFASVRQKFYVRYEGGSLFPEGSDNCNTKNKFWGLGPLVELSTDWNLISRLSLFGKIGFSLTTGEFYIHQAERERPSRTPHLKFHNLFDASAALFNLALGLKWSSHQWSASLGFEQFFLPRQNQLDQFLQPTGKFVSQNGNLSLIGLSCSFQYRF